MKQLWGFFFFFPSNTKGEESVAKGVKVTFIKGPHKHQSCPPKDQLWLHNLQTHLNKILYYTSVCLIIMYVKKYLCAQVAADLHVPWSAILEYCQGLQLSVRWPSSVSGFQFGCLFVRVWACCPHWIVMESFKTTEEVVEEANVIWAGFRCCSVVCDRLPVYCLVVLCYPDAKVQICPSWSECHYITWFK